MRSRDGDRYILFRFSTIIFVFLVSSLFCDEYYISYRYIVKDAVLYNESLLVSPAMKKCEGDTYAPITLENNNYKSLKRIISHNSQKFIDYLHKLGLQVKHESKTTNQMNSSTTTLTLKTKCFKVDFNDNFAKLEPLK